MPRKKKVAPAEIDKIIAEMPDDPTDEEIARRDKERRRQMDRSGRILSVLHTAQLLFVEMSSNGRGGNESIKIAEGCIALAEVFEDAADRYRDEKEKA